MILRNAPIDSEKLDEKVFLSQNYHISESTTKIYLPNENKSFLLALDSFTQRLAMCGVRALFPFAIHHPDQSPR
jgi:hypothetical protein